MPNTAPPRNMPKKKIVLAPIQRVLAKVRPMWIERVGKELARGMEVRADFEEQEMGRSRRLSGRLFWPASTTIEFD